MASDQYAKLRRKYLSLGTGELASAALFSVVAGSRLSPPLLVGGSSDFSRALWCALVPLLAVLVQAGIYWLLARRWVVIGRMPARVAATYRVLRVIDAGLLAAGLVGALLWWPDELGPALLVAAVWLFGVVEYVNYFVIRLAYPVRQWPSRMRRPRRPRLWRDVSSAAR